MKIKSRLWRAVRAGVREYDWSRLRPRNWDFTKIIPAFSVMIHPIETFEDIKFRRRGSLGLANLILLCCFLVVAVNSGTYGFLFNYTEPGKGTLISAFLRTVGLVFLWTLVNWSLSTLLDGEGRFGEIWIATCYSLMPIVLFGLIGAFLSNVITIDEEPILTIFNLYYIWSLFLIVCSVKAIQQCSVKKTVGMLCISIIGMVAVLFLLLLLFSLFQELFLFLQTIVNELSYR